MSGRAGQRKRLISVTPANIRESHLYITGHADLFPADCYGAPSERAGSGKPIQLDVLGLPEPVVTDIPTDAKTGKPRRFFRKRAWVKEFFDTNDIQAGDTVCIEQTGQRRFKISPGDSSNGRVCDSDRRSPRQGNDRRSLPPDSPLRFAEFFAGIGLVRMGLERSSSKWQCVFANDLDPVKREIYAGHFGTRPDHIDGSDVHALPGDNVPDVELATASFPCTDLSLAGGRKGIRSGESSAFWGFHRVIQEMGDRKPPIVLLENVVGLLNSHGGADFRDLLVAMNQLGYAVDPFILDARWFVPQSRPRMFIVCVLGGEQAHQPAWFQTESRIRPAKLIDFMSKHTSEIRWAACDLPEPPQSAEASLADIVQDPPAKSEDWWSEDRVAYLLDQMFPRHKAWVDERLHRSRFSYATAFRRVRPQGDGTKRSMAELRTDGIAGCLRTPKGGSGRQILLRVGRGRVSARLLSGPECASLMGAGGYRLSCSLNQALFGFGDAVCVDAIAWIARNYIEPALARVQRQVYAVAGDVSTEA